MLTHHLAVIEERCSIKKKKNSRDVVIRSWSLLFLLLVLAFLFAVLQFSSISLPLFLPLHIFVLLLFFQCSIVYLFIILFPHLCTILVFFLFFLPSFCISLRIPPSRLFAFLKFFSRALHYLFLSPRTSLSKEIEVKIHHTYLNSVVVMQQKILFFFL